MRMILLRPGLWAGAEQACEIAHGCNDLVRPHGQAVIRFGAEQCRRAFDRIDAAHRAAGFARAPCRCEMTRISEPSGRRRNEIAFDAENPLRFGEIENALDVLPKAALRG